jgi:hypothetical protein
LQQELAGSFAEEVRSCRRGWMEHGHGHAMPQRAEDLKTLVAFLMAACS